MHQAPDKYRTQRTQELSLSALDGRILDGLDFCQKVYDLFEELGREPEGAAKLRLRPTKREKRLIEELIPIARYIQARYREGRRIKIRWYRGSQPYDGILWSSGTLVEKGIVPRKLVVEVTTSVHENEYLYRRLLHERGGSFGVKGISRDKKTGRIISEPYAHKGDELATDLANRIIARLASKGEKAYPPETVLIVYCVSDAPILESEWNQAIGGVANAHLHTKFREVFLFEPIMSHSATLCGNRKKRRTLGTNDVSS